MAETRITLEMVQHVARLARLKLSDIEQERLLTDLGQMLEYVAQLDELDTKNVPPTAQVGEAGTPRREDAVTCPSDQEAMLANAPSAERGYFRVPKIIE